MTKAGCRFLNLNLQYQLSYAVSVPEPVSSKGVTETNHTSMHLGSRQSHELTIVLNRTV